MKLYISVAVILAWNVISAWGYAFVAKKALLSRELGPSAQLVVSTKSRNSSSLKMVDQNVILGGGVALAGLVAGIGIVAFTESQGERAKARGSGLSESMTTKIAGGLIEDVEVSTVSDLGSLTSQLEKALRETGGADDKVLEMTEEEKKKIAAEADDGW